jgi:hypothetical protein
MAERDPQEQWPEWPEEFDLAGDALPDESAALDRGPADSPEVEQVLEANDRFYAAFSNRDPEAMEELWARNLPVACIHPNWQPVTTRQQVMDSWRAILRNPHQPRVVAGGANVRLVGEGVAYLICREFVGGTPLAVTNIFVLEDGEWRIVLHHSSQVARKR